MNAYLLTIMGASTNTHPHAYLQIDKEETLEVVRHKLADQFKGAGGSIIAMLETKLDTGRRDTIRKMLRRRAPPPAAWMPPKNRVVVVFFATTPDDPDDKILMEIH
jgi:hypothetical protein